MTRRFTRHLLGFVSVVALFAALWGVAAPAEAETTAAVVPASPQQGLTGQVVVVTGAQRGIGLALVRELLAQGAQVIAGHLPQADARELKAAAAIASDRLIVQQLDVTREASVKDFVQSIKSPAVDAIINNAGVNLDEKFRLDDIPIDRIRQTFEVNTLGPVRMLQHLLPKLLAAKRPVVANISSVMGSIGENAMGGTDAYRMSKAALNMFTRGLSIEQPHLIVLSLHPGWVKTQMGGNRAEITVEQSAAALVGRVRDAKREQSGHFLRYSGETIGW